MPDANVMREYISQLRTELGLRLLDKVYESDQSQPSKVTLHRLQIISPREEVQINTFLYSFSVVALLL